MIDDDREFCALIGDYLSDFGYAVSMAHTGPAGVEQASLGPWHAIILDVMLPGMDGFAVLKNIRRACDVPVLMLTARGDEMDQIVGLELGADDYLPKGSSTRQLLARLRAITRRAAHVENTVPVNEVVVGPLRIHVDAHTASLHDKPLSLTASEYTMLLALARAKNRVKSRDQLLDEVRDREWEIFDRSIDVMISALRRKLGDDPKTPRFIRTIRSAGYMLVDPDAPPAL